MAEGAEQFEEYKGFTIRVLAIAEYSPHPPGIPFGYVGYVARPGANLRFGSQQVQFVHPVPDFPTDVAAEQAGFAEGRSIIDGTHATLTTSAL
jgi:hypothetical protein